MNYLKYLKYNEHWCNRYFERCGNWMCVCRHLTKDHALGICLEECSCEDYTFLSNDLCSLECAFYKKVADTEKSS